MATQKKIAGGELKPNSRRTDGENIFLIVIIYGLFLITIKKGESTNRAARHFADCDQECPIYDHNQQKGNRRDRAFLIA
jgi:alpha-acetolactate decarboxylase